MIITQAFILKKQENEELSLSPTSDLRGMLDVLSWLGLRGTGCTRAEQWAGLEAGLAMTSFQQEQRVWGGEAGNFWKVPCKLFDHSQ